MRRPVMPPEETPSQEAVERLIDDIQTMVSKIGARFEPDADKVKMFAAAMAVMANQAKAEVASKASAPD